MNLCRCWTLDIKSWLRRMADCRDDSQHNPPNPCPRRKKPATFRRHEFMMTKEQAKTYLAEKLPERIEIIKGHSSNWFAWGESRDTIPEESWQQIALWSIQKFKSDINKRTSYYRALESICGSANDAMFADYTQIATALKTVDETSK